MDFHQPSVRMPQFDFPRLEPAAAQRHNDHVTASGPQHRLARNRYCTPHDHRVEDHRGEHPLAQAAVRIRHGDLDRQRPGLFRQFGFDELDRAADPLAREVGKGHLRLGAGTDPHHLVLEDLDRQPQGGDVGDVVRLHARRYRHALETRHPFHDQTARRRGHRQRAEDLARFLEAGDLIRGDVPEREPRPCRFHQSLGMKPGVVRRVAQPGRVPDRRQQFMCGLDQLRRVDLEQPLALRHGLADVVDVDLLDPAVVLRRHGDHPLLVVLEVADGPDLVPEIPPLHHPRLDVHVLDHDRVDRDGRSGAERLLRLVGVDRHVVHSHFVLGRYRRGDRRIHRIPVEDDLAFAAGGRGSFTAARRHRPGLVADRPLQPAVHRMNAQRIEEEDIEGREAARDPPRGAEPGSDNMSGAFRLVRHCSVPPLAGAGSGLPTAPSSSARPIR